MVVSSSPRHLSRKEAKVKRKCSDLHGQKWLVDFVLSDVSRHTIFWNTWLFNIEC